MKRIVTMIIAASAAACVTEPEASDPSFTPYGGGCYDGDVHPGCTYDGPSPSQFNNCKLVHDDGTSISVPPTFLVRRPDARNALYCPGSVPCDGYQIPFPTPWIRDATHPTCVDPVHCLLDPGPYRYEEKLVSDVVGIVSHQFDVYTLTFVGSKYTVGDATVFYNGTLNNTQLDEMKGVVTDPRWTTTYSDVDPHLVRCPYVLQLSNTSTLAFSGFHAQVGQTHLSVVGP